MSRLPPRGAHAALAGAALWLSSACSGGNDPGLVERIPCGDGQQCRAGLSCLGTECVEDGSRGPGDTCSLPEQCAQGLVCKDFECVEGCVDVYYKDDCAGDTWCKPVPGEVVTLPTGDVPAGECVPAECDPSAGGDCGPGMACVVITATVGACLPYCEYGFVGGAYVDNCDDDTEAGVDYACQPLGLTHVPVCLPAGGVGSPGVGIPGCDAVRNPCRPGAICHDVVCRRLCTPAQLDPCDPGQSCAPVGQRTDVAYCLAD